MPQRRFPPPWLIEEQEACFTVRDENGQALGYFYFEEEPGRRTRSHSSTEWLGSSTNGRASSGICNPCRTI
jgi:hypothetical protein